MSNVEKARKLNELLSDGILRMRKHKMTNYDAGQDLIACADYLSEKEMDLRDAGYKGLADMLRSCRLTIGTAFNKRGSHVFQIPDDSDASPEKESEKDKPNG